MRPGRSEMEGLCAAGDVEVNNVLTIKGLLSCLYLYRIGLTES